MAVGELEGGLSRGGRGEGHGVNASCCRLLGCLHLPHLYEDRAWKVISGNVRRSSQETLDEWIWRLNPDFSLVASVSSCLPFVSPFQMCPSVPLSLVSLVTLSTPGPSALGSGGQRGCGLWPPLSWVQILGPVVFFCLILWAGPTAFLPNSCFLC